MCNNASEVVRESLRLLKEHDEIRQKIREQIERGWLQAQAGELVDANPSRDIRNTRRIRYVIKDGRMVRATGRVGAQ